MVLKHFDPGVGMWRISMGTRDEPLKAVASRYRSATRTEKGRILTEFAKISGYDRKHAERLLRCEDVTVRPRPRPERRVYGVAVREALVLLLQASDRICGKRLKPLISLLIPAMERHGHLAMDDEVKTRLLRISAATIDRVLAPVRGRFRRKASAKRPFLGRPKKRADPNTRRLERPGSGVFGSRSGGA